MNFIHSFSLLNVQRESEAKMKNKQTKNSQKHCSFKLVGRNLQFNKDLCVATLLGQSKM